MIAYTRLSPEDTTTVTRALYEAEVPFMVLDSEQHDTKKAVVIRSYDASVAARALSMNGWVNATWRTVTGSAKEKEFAYLSTKGALRFRLPYMRGAKVFEPREKPYSHRTKKRVRVVA